MRMTIVLFCLLFFNGCKTSDVLVEDPSGTAYVPHILTPENLITCKEVYYCKYEGEEDWKKCIVDKDPEFVHTEIACIDLGNDDNFFIDTDSWDKKWKHHFGLYHNEDVFKLLKNLDYVKQNTQLYKNEIPKMVEKFKEFHK